MPRSASPKGTMNVAGILGPDGKLTAEAKDKFITDIENELLFGTPNIALPCGDPLLPQIDADRVDLHDESLYPAFHRSWVTKYEEIANVLNLPRCQLPGMPILDITIFMDPLPDIDFNIAIDLLSLSLPDLAIKIPKLGLKLPQPFPPDLPPPFPDLTIPKLDFGFDLSLDLPHIKFQIDLLLKLPQIMLQLALPNIVLPKLPNIALLLPDVCKTLRENVFKSEYSDTDKAGADTTDLAASLILSRQTAKMATVDVCGLVTGCPGVITLGTSKAVDLSPPPIKQEEPTTFSTYYDIDDFQFWDNYVNMCNRLEIDPLVLGQVIQFESQWIPFNRVIGGATKAMGFVMTMPWWYTGHNKNAFPMGLRMRQDYWNDLYYKKSTASRHATDDLFWTEQFFINTWMGSKGTTLKSLKTPKMLYDNIVNPSYNKEGGHAPFVGATIKEPFKGRIMSAMQRVGTALGTRLPQPDGTKSAKIDWTSISMNDVLTHPFGTNQSWWKNLPETT